MYLLYLYQSDKYFHIIVSESTKKSIERLCTVFKVQIISTIFELKTKTKLLEVLFFVYAYSLIKYSNFFY